MKNEGEVRWLQLSDLHMFDSTTMRYQKAKMYERFKGTIDFIIITGDLHQYGEDYSLTLDFLNELVEKTEGLLNRSFGNPGENGHGCSSLPTRPQPATYIFCLV